MRTWNVYLTLGAATLLALLVAATGWLLLRRPGRAESLTSLLDLADRLESDLKTCRSGLQQAYAVMSINPDLPAAGEEDAQHAIDAGLRALLQALSQAQTDLDSAMRDHIRRDPDA
jgi:hypothetical protein